MSATKVRALVETARAGGADPLLVGIGVTGLDGGSLRPANRRSGACLTTSRRSSAAKTWRPCSSPAAPHACAPTGRLSRPRAGDTPALQDVATWRSGVKTDSPVDVPFAWELEVGIWEL